MGYIFGIIFVYSVYLFALFGIFYQLKNGELPFAPLILFILMLTWRRAVQIHTLLILFSRTTASYYSKKYISNDKLDMLMQQVMKHGGPN